LRGVPNAGKRKGVLRTRNLKTEVIDGLSKGRVFFQELEKNKKAPGTCLEKKKRKGEPEQEKGMSPLNTKPGEKQRDVPLQGLHRNKRGQSTEKKKKRERIKVGRVESKKKSHHPDGRRAYFILKIEKKNSGKHTDFGEKVGSHAGKPKRRKKRIPEGGGKS